MTSLKLLQPPDVASHLLQYSDISEETPFFLKKKKKRNLSPNPSIQEIM